MSVKGVAAGSSIQVVFEPVGCRKLGQPLLAGDRVLAGHPVFAGQMAHHVALPPGGRGTVELEAAPHHLDVAVVFKARDSGLHSPLADIAPGTDDVGPDLYFHDLYNRTAGLDLPLGSAFS